MKSVIIIPARYSSTRLPGKPLLRETGKYLIQYTFETARMSKKASSVIIATDDERIAAAVREFGADVVMTSPDCPSGTDRIAEAARNIEAEVIVNLQGDEPEMPPSHIDTIIGLFENDDELSMATLAVKKSGTAWLENPSEVKVEVDAGGFARKFSRRADTGARVLKHLGIYGYRRSFLLEFVNWPPSQGESRERLEQLRALERGVRIRVAEVGSGTTGIDTRDDYDMFCKRWRTRGE